MQDNSCFLVLEKSMEKLKKLTVFIVGTVGFIASIFGIIQFLQSVLHFGSILVPNPVIIVVAIAVSVISWYCVFRLGCLYGPYSILASLFKMRNSYSFWTFFLGYYREWLIAYHLSLQRRKKLESPLAHRLRSTEGKHDTK